MCVSSIASSVPCRRVSSRNPSWKPGSGSRNPAFVIAGSASTNATSPGASACSSASRSLNGTIRSCAVISLGRPVYSGRIRPSSTIPSVGSRWPWYFPSNTTIFSRPVRTRATRTISVFAWVADSVNCHFGIP